VFCNYYKNIISARPHLLLNVNYTMFMMINGYKVVGISNHINFCENIDFLFQNTAYGPYFLTLGSLGILRRSGECSRRNNQTILISSITDNLASPNNKGFINHDPVHCFCCCTIEQCPPNKPHPIPFTRTSSFLISVPTHPLYTSSLLSPPPSPVVISAQ
jgi:hypothetical protein